MLNPEFKRNLWREFPGHRLLAMPLMLGLILITASMADSYRMAEYLHRTAAGLFVFIVWFWGARNASTAVSDELRDHTWDQQRLSALEPWSMTWGKLFGATSYNWYGGLICLAVALPAGVLAKGLPALINLGTMVASGILIQGAVLALTLQLGRRQASGEYRQNGIGWLVVVLIFSLLTNLTGKNPGQPFAWWNLAIDREVFLLASSLLFAGITVFAAWRVMSNALQVRTLPWAWPLLSLLLALYLAGLGDVAGQAHLSTLPMVALATALAMTYAALFTEPCGRLELRRLQHRWLSGEWRAGLEILPLWPTTLLLAMGFGLLATLIEPPPQVLLSRPNLLTGLPPLALALMLLRDCALMLFFSCAPRPGQPAWTTLLTLGALDLLLPFFAKATGMTQLAWFILPLGDGNPWAAVLVMTLQVGVTLGLLGWRLRGGMNGKAI